MTALEAIAKKEKVTIGDKTYKLNIEKAKELGLLEEASTFKISNTYTTGAFKINVDYTTGAMIITE